MELKDFIAAAKTTEEGKEIWLSNKTFNELTSEAEKIRINEAGYLELRYTNVVVQVSMESKLSWDNGRGVSYVEVVSITEHANYTGLKVKDIFMRPTKNVKCANIL